MKVHEFQAKQLFSEFGIPVPRGMMIKETGQVRAAVEKTGFPCVIKAQVHAGGRGKAGGIRKADDFDAACQAAGDILGMTLVSAQTGPGGKRVRKILLEQAAQIAGENYLALLIDREIGMPVFVACPEGGVEIEEVAEKRPELIKKIHINPVIGLWNFHIRLLAVHLGVKKESFVNFSRLVRGVYRLFLERDAALVEINPLALTADGQWLALDAKVNFDDNGLARQPDIVALRDLDEEEPLEVEASKHDLNYIRLDGNIGCMVNGAGLAMATMDIIHHYGGSPANFLDVGGGTSAERVGEAFRILLADTNVRVVFVNIFGGIVRTDQVAEGIVRAARDIQPKVSVIVRLKGTNEEEGRRIIAESGLNFFAETDLEKAVKMAVEMAGR